MLIFSDVQAFCQQLWAPTKRQDDIVVATGVEKLAVKMADMVAYMVADMEVGKMANMVAGMEVDWALTFSTWSFNIRHVHLGKDSYKKRFLSFTHIIVVIIVTWFCDTRLKKTFFFIGVLPYKALRVYLIFLKVHNRQDDFFCNVDLPQIYVRGRLFHTCCLLSPRLARNQ